MKTSSSDLIYSGASRCPSNENEDGLHRSEAKSFTLKRNSYPQDKIGVDVGLEGDCDCDGAVAVGMRVTCKCIGIRRKELRSHARYVGVIRHARRCGTGDVD